MVGICGETMLILTGFPGRLPILCRIKILLFLAKKELTSALPGDMIQKEYSLFVHKFTLEESEWKW